MAYRSSERLASKCSPRGPSRHSFIVSWTLISWETTGQPLLSMPRSSVRISTTVNTGARLRFGISGQPKYQPLTNLAARQWQCPSSLSAYFYWKPKQRNKEATKKSVTRITKSNKLFEERIDEREKGSFEHEDRRECEPILLSFERELYTS